jgi:MATE family multidrug resistance protein
VGSHFAPLGTRDEGAASNPCLLITHGALARPLLTGGAWYLPAELVMVSVRQELRALVALALPAAGSTYCFFAISITELSVMGHLGVAQLAAVAYSQVALDLTMLVFMQGFNAGLNALGAQAFGARNFHLLGAYALLAAFLLTLACVPVAVLWWNLGDLLAAAGVTQQVADYARTYCRLALLWLWPRSMFQIMAIFYQAQEIVVPTTCFNAVTVVTNAVLASGLTHGLFGLPALGFVGCPLGTTIALALRLVGYALYMNVYRKLHRRCACKWNGQFLDVRLMRQLIGVGVPLAAGMLFEDAQLVTMTLFAARIGEVQLGAHNAMMELFMFMTSPVYGVIQAAVTRIGIHLGAGKPHVAVLAAQITACGIATLATINSAIIVGFRGQLGKIFSDDPQVVAMFSQICSFAALAYLILAFFYYAIVRFVVDTKATPWRTC